METLQEAPRPESPCAMPPATVFPREFRWTFHTEFCKEITNFTKEASVDLLNRVIKVQVMEVILGGVYNPILEFVKCWIAFDINSIDDADTLTLNFYDGCGNCLDRSRFLNPKLVGHSYGLDYGKNEPVTHHLTFSFDSLDVQCPVEKEEPIPMGTGALGATGVTNDDRYELARKEMQSRFARATKMTKKKNSRKN